MFGDGLQAAVDQAANLVPDDAPVFLEVFFSKLPRRNRLPVSLLDAVIGDMYCVVKLVESEVLSTDAQVSLLEDEALERLPRRDEHPLADVELLAVEEERLLDVLLDDLRRSLLSWLDDLVQFARAEDTEAARIEARLHYP